LIAILKCTSKEYIVGGESAFKGIVSTLSSPFNVLLKLFEIVEKYQRKKKTESRLVSAFENEIRTYLDIYEKAMTLSEKKIIPILQSVGNELTPRNMNEFLEAMLPMPLIQAEWIEAFISIAKACDEVSVLKGLMDYLKESDIVLYDFVHVMKDMYVRKEERVIIDGRYYRFFKTYENDIFGRVEAEEINMITRELKPYVEKMSRFVKKIRHYARQTAFIKRQILKKYKKNYRILVKAAPKMIVEKTTASDLRGYVPEKFLPISIFIEELSL